MMCGCWDEQDEVGRNSKDRSVISLASLQGMRNQLRPEPQFIGKTLIRSNQMPHFFWRAAVKLLLLPLCWSSPASAETLLDIYPVHQQTPVWCWAAVGEMIFRYYGVANINPVDNFQCGIIALVHPICSQNCGNCVIPAGSLGTMNEMLTGYPRFASRISGNSTHVTTSVSRRSLSFANLQQEIDQGRPVVAGISPSGYRHPDVSEHVALIVGYDADNIIVNDPFPFSSTAFSGDPYLAAGGNEIAPGQYRIEYAQFRQRLQWQESIHGIRCSGPGCEERNTDDSDSDGDGDDEYDREDHVTTGRSCATPVTRCGPFYNQPELPLGTPCYCATPYGPAHGRVVRP